MKKIGLIIILLLNFLSLKAQLNTDKIFNVGANALYFKDYMLAIQYFNQIIKVKPYLTQPLLYRAIAKINLEDYTGALADLDNVIAKNEFIPMAYYARGFVYNRLEKYDLAEKDLTKALEFSPENTTFLLLRLEALNEQKKYEQELRDLDFLSAKLGKLPELALTKGQTLILSGDTIGAFDVMNDLVKNDSLDFNSWGGRAFVNMLLNKKDSALADYNQAVRLNSNNLSHFINRGILLYEKKNYRGALADYDKAITLSPQNEQALFNRSLLRTEIGDYNNALNDLNEVLKINPTLYEAVYQRAMINSALGKNADALADFSKIIERYPEFIPAYYGRANAYEQNRNKKAAYEDMQAVIRIEENRKKNQGKEKPQEPDTEVKVAQSESSVSSWWKLFASSQSESEDDSRYKNNLLRGNIQNRDAEAELQGDFVLSPYKKDDATARNYYFQPLAQLNRQNREMLLRLVNQEVALTDALINYHFKMIDNLSEKLQKESENANIYFLRGINYALVQDFNSAIADFSAAIFLKSDAVFYFCRAVVRHKQLEVSIGGVIVENNTDNGKDAAKDATHHVSTLPEKQCEMIIRDYDKAIELAPDFSFAWFNRGNILCSSKDYKAAIANYSNALNIDRDFAEAYFNRALTFIYIGDTDKGIADLSKAGELGIYQAYNLLKKLRK
ncbi:MAG: tetratricopeptide repeat protein [Prevotellaceae bacterium]|jgi:tetratricopeptide (TPR) repeat protein|nr:tetratricopeptide repeat protein [Prevotellaceae bacterium]